jgi:hypothetical protein
MIRLMVSAQLLSAGAHPMPGATPVPRGPSHLTLYGAEDLLAAEECPVCRYVAEVDGRFLGWFALGGHADASMITRLCESLGLCPRHTRGLLAQPGADARLTPVYRYLLRAAREYLTSGEPPRMACPACARDVDGAGRALDTLLAGLQEAQVRDRYTSLGGLCVPHVRAAAGHAGRRDAAWLADIALSRLASGQASFAMLAGATDPDAEVRAGLRSGLTVIEPRTAAESAAAGERAGRCGVACVVCCAAAKVERDCLIGITGLPGSEEPQGIRACELCAAHLQDAWAQAVGARAGAGASPRDLSSGLLVSLREDAMSWLGRDAVARSGLAVMNPLSRRRRIRPGSGPAECPVCRAAQSAAQQHLSALGAAPGPGMPPSMGAPGPGEPGVCVRHVFSLRELNSGAGAVAARRAISRADQLVAGLEEAFRKRTWAHRHEARGHEMSAWRRAAALIDGRVYGGGPPAPL